jgi:hypothetical protein
MAMSSGGDKCKSSDPMTVLEDSTLKGKMHRDRTGPDALDQSDSQVHVLSGDFAVLGRVALLLLLEYSLRSVWSGGLWTMALLITNFRVCSKPWRSARPVTTYLLAGLGRLHSSDPRPFLSFDSQQEHSRGMHVDSTN